MTKIKEILEKYSEKVYMSEMVDTIIRSNNFNKLEKELQEYYDNKPPSLDYIKPKWRNNDKNR